MSGDNDSPSFVGRDDKVAALTALLRRSTSQGPKLRVASVSGPGGIGKSFLVRHIETASDIVDSEHYLKLELHGAATMRSTARLVTTDLVQSVGASVDLAEMFPQTLHLREVLARIDDIARTELRDIESEFGEWVSTLFSVGVGALGLHSHGKVLAKVLGTVDDKQVEKFAKHVERAYRSEAGVKSWLPAVAERNRVRANVLGHLARALVADLRGLVDGVRYRRVLLVIDDYESLEPMLGTFLLDELLPLLRDESFETTLVIVGRDRVRDTNASWLQHYAQNLAGNDIELVHLTKDESASLIRARLGAGVDDAVVQRIIADTEGYPYLIDSEVEDALTGGGTALSLRNFVDRTTRWMTAEQREWMQAVCFLDVVNEDSIADVLPDATPAVVLDWFEREASIRSPHTKHYARCCR